MTAAEQAPTVSIGLPVFNGSQFLPRTLESLLGQQFRDFELIISDNASTDSTRDICEDAADSDDRVRYVRQPENYGAAWNYNYVVRQAHGRYFTWASHDDLRHGSHLERCVVELETAEQTPVLVYPRTLLIGEDDHVLRDYDDGLDLPQARASRRAESLLRNLGLANAVFGLIRLDALRSTGLIRPFVYSDLVLLYELALRGRFVEIPDALFSRRMHNDMSHRANPSAESRLSWFTGAASADKPVLARSRLYREMVRATLDAPLPATDRARCLGQLLRVWGPKYSKHITTELAGASVAVASRALNRSE